MQALMQEWSLTLDKLLEHAAKWHGSREIVTRSAEGPITRTSYAAVHARAKQVSNALKSAGIEAGDRIATLAWNSARHLEACYGIIGIGAVHHTLNPRLFPEQLVYIVNHAEDRLILADPSCAALLEAIVPKCPTVERVIFLCATTFKPATSFQSVAYDDWIAGESTSCAWGGFDENSAAGLCYTSGTTGNPKGVLYGHRSNYIHAMMTLQTDALALSARDSVLLVVPMYHANAWGVVYSAPLVGAKLVLPGQKMDGASIHELLESESVSYSAAVPTVWQMLLDHLRATGGKLSTLRRVTIGGSACPESIIRAFREDYGVDVIQGWGMTETSPLATVAHPSAEVAALSFEEQLPFKLKQGRLLGNLDLKLVDDSGQRLPNDGVTFGRLMIKGPTVARRYFRGDRDALDDEGYFDTGDVARLDANGVMQIVDRAKDVIKSGGEWISSIDVENIVVGHPKVALAAVIGIAHPKWDEQDWLLVPLPKVALAAVIGIAHPKWDERPILLVQLKPGETEVAGEFLRFLEGKIARWWMPDHVLVVDEIPLGPTGKVDKKTIRQRLADYPLSAATERVE